MAKVERGTTLGSRFRIDELIGGGGMGSVYSAFDLEQGFCVAVKLLNPRLARATEFRLRFLDESKYAAGIPHPHILTVYDHGEDEGWHYLAMSLIEDDLAAFAERERPLALTRTLNIADQVAWALDVAHEHGLVHRDVKPENILVTSRYCSARPLSRPARRPTPPRRVGSRCRRRPPPGPPGNRIRLRVTAPRRTRSTRPATPRTVRPSSRRWRSPP